MRCFSPFAIGKVACKLHQAAQSNSGRPLGDPRFLLLGPGGAGDVEVDPGGVLGEFLEEHGGGDGAAIAAAGVHDVGDVGANDLLVLVIQRHAPHFFAGLVEGLAEAVVHGVVVGEDAGVDVAESDDDGAGERGGVDQVGAAELARVEKAVGENQAAFGVGVDDLD